MDSIHFRSEIFSPFRHYYDCSKQKNRNNFNGYPKHRFLDPPPKEFLCGICAMVVKKPLECSKCGKLYCDTCSKILKKTESSEKKTSECLNCHSTKDLRKPSLLLKKLIDESKVFCCNLDKGCLEIVELEGILKHESKCPYKEVVCENHKYCKKSGILKEFVETELMFPGISAALTGQSSIRQKSFVCSERCKNILCFQRVVMNKEGNKALVEYFELVKECEMLKGGKE